MGIEVVGGIDVGRDGDGDGYRVRDKYRDGGRVGDIDKARLVRGIEVEVRIVIEIEMEPWVEI